MPTEPTANSPIPSEGTATGWALRDPVEHVCSLYEHERSGSGAVGRAIVEREWSLGDVYRELGSGAPRRSELDTLFAGFFNGQLRALLASWDEDDTKLEFWAGIPERGAALRDRALERLSGHDVAIRERLRASEAVAVGLDAETRALILAHNQIDAELHAHCIGASARRAATASGTGPSGTICVLGASRSGTSLTTRILNVLGVDLGSEAHLMAPVAGNNPKGFWEHEAIVKLDEDILGVLTGQTPSPRPMWFRPPPLPDGWERNPVLRPHRSAARAILRESFAGAQLWGWKDPRACLTLPFWQMLVPELRYVVCVRHPFDAAASLQARDGVAPEAGLWLWLLYTAHAVLNTQGRPRVFVSHEGYFPSWERQAERLAKFVGNGPMTTVQEAAIREHIEDRLWHHRDGSQRDEELPTESVTLYRQLDELARTGPNAATEAELDDAARLGLAAAEAWRATHAARGGVAVTRPRQRRAKDPRERSVRGTA